MNNENPELRRGRNNGKRRPEGLGPNGGPGRGRRRRPLAHGDLRLLILNIVNTTPSHGYGLITEIKNLTSGYYEPSPGVIYPALEALQDLGWVEVQPDKGKRVLNITKSGKIELEQQSDTLKLIEDRLAKLGFVELEIEPDDVRGAMRQLKHTTISVVKGNPTDIARRKAAVRTLKEAQKKINNLRD